MRVSGFKIICAKVIAKGIASSIVGGAFLLTNDVLENVVHHYFPV